MGCGDVSAALVEVSQKGMIKRHVKACLASRQFAGNMPRFRKTIVSYTVRLTENDLAGNLAGNSHVPGFHSTFSFLPFCLPWNLRFSPVSNLGLDYPDSYRCQALHKGKRKYRPKPDLYYHFEPSIPFRWSCYCANPGHPVSLDRQTGIAENTCVWTMPQGLRKYLHRSIQQEKRHEKH